MRTLYLCYFGLREPLVQTQVLPYLRELRKRGVEVFLLTFESDHPRPWSEDEESRWRDTLREQGIEWQTRAYHKWPSVPATFYDILLGGITAARIARRREIRIFHARAHLAMAMAVIAGWLTRGKTIFDFRGLVADEYVDAGIWKASSPVYRIFKAFERFALRRADQIVVLTEKMQTLLIEREAIPTQRIEVIPCCTDMSRYRPRTKETRSHSPFIVVYAGSVTGLYLFQEMAELFLSIKKQWPDAVFQILTASSPDWPRRKLIELGLKEQAFEILSVQPEDIPKYLSHASVGLSFRKATYSQTAASPTKIPEYLAAGLPVISNAGIGDTDDMIRANRIGLVLSDLTADSYNKAAFELQSLLSDTSLSARCRETASTQFDLHTIGGTRYEKVYKKLQASCLAPPYAGQPQPTSIESPDVEFSKEG
jgi:glycosyltransferase involved in cell wall biosynthesis